jgi:hypothetical protein
MTATTNVTGQTLFAWIAFGFGSLVLSAVIIVLIRRWKRVLDILDIPDHRRSHVQATPRGAEFFEGNISVDRDSKQHNHVAI